MGKALSSIIQMHQEHVDVEKALVYKFIKIQETSEIRTFVHNFQNKINNE